MRQGTSIRFLLGGGALLGLASLGAGLWQMITQGAFGPEVHAFFDPPVTPATEPTGEAPAADTEAAQSARLAPWTGAPPAGPRGPDILMVTLCSLRTDRTAAGLADPRGWTARPTRHRPTQSQTPHLDALAGRSITLTNAWTNAPFTAPAHAALFTSLLPEHSGVVDLGDTLPVDVPTLPEILSLYGYRTLAYAPVDTLPGDAPERGESCRMVAGGQAAAAPGGRHGAATFRRGGGFERGIRHFFEGNSAACDAALLDSLTKDPGPFFALVHLKEAHMPYGLREADPDTLDPRLAAWARADLAPTPLHGKDQALLEELDDDPDLQEALSQAYDGAVRRADAHLGLLLDGLAARGRLDDTLVVVLGDHGESLGDNGDLGHQGSMRPEVLHVPLVVHLPGGARAGVTEAGPAAVVDLPLTLLQAVGATLPAQTDGQGLLAALQGEIPWPVHPLLAEGRIRIPGKGRFPHHLFILGEDGLSVIQRGEETAYQAIHRGPEGWSDVPTDDAALRAAYDALAGPSRARSATPAFSPAERSQLQRQGYW